MYYLGAYRLINSIVWKNAHEQKQVFCIAAAMGSACHIVLFQHKIAKAFTKSLAKRNKTKHYKDSCNYGKRLPHFIIPT